MAGQRFKRVIAAIFRAVIALGKSDDEYARARACDNKTQRVTHQRRASLKARTPPRFSQQIVWVFVAAFGIV